MRSWQVLKIWDIPVRIHANWLLLLFFFSWSVSNQINLTSSDIFIKREAWLIGFSTSFLFLGSIILNQIFHTYVCLKEGVKIKNITFFFLGAILIKDKECKNAIGNIKIALVRPLTYLFVSFILLLLSLLGNPKETIILNILSRVGSFSLFLGFLNLIPVGSLDGGVLFKSIVWYFSGSKSKGRILLNNSTTIISIFSFLVGVFVLFNISFYYGLIFSLLGIFGFNASRSESQFMRVEKILKSTKVSEIKLNPLKRIEINSNFLEFNKLAQRKNQQNRDYFFITNNGRWDGYITDDVLRSVSIKKWERTYVQEFRKSINEFPSENECMPLWKIIEKLEKTSDGILLIVNSAGIPKGLIDRSRVGYFIFMKLGINLSLDILNKFKYNNSYPLGIELPKIIEIMRKKGEIE